MELKRLRIHFLKFLLKNMIFSLILTYFIGIYYKEIKVLWVFLLIITIRYVLRYKYFNLKIKKYFLYRKIFKKYGVLNKRKVYIINYVLDKKSGKISFKEWIDGHEYLYSGIELKMMFEIWNDKY